jgi:hypothetical protein
MFFGEYDFTNWLKGLPEERARMLLTGEGIAKRARRKSGRNPTPFPVYVRDKGVVWELDVLGMKRFKLRPQKGHRGWMYVCDTGNFFQSSLLSVINPEKWEDPVVSEEEYRLIEKGKMRRSSAVLDDEMRMYNRLENVVLSRVLERLNQGFVEAGVRLKRNQWFGPGQAAQEWLKATGVLKREQLGCVPDAVLKAAQRAYYGGWFEIPCHGIVEGLSYEYDINSAYPYVASKLPCLEHGRWIHDTVVLGDDVGSFMEEWKLIHAVVEGSNRYFGTMPHRRSDGKICRPHRTSGWYWASELRAAMDAGLVDDVRIDESWTYVPCDCQPPLKGLEELYLQRLAVGKDTVLGMANKLIYNSAYGKFAQSEGNPIFGNAVYASRITSGCREMILRAMATHSLGASGVLMVATDAVFFSEPHEGLVLGQGLGEWGYKERSNLTLFKPGVYWDDAARMDVREGRQPRFKARGVNARAFSRELERIDEMFREWGGVWPGTDVSKWPSVEFPVEFSMTSAVQALAWGKWDKAGYVQHDKIVRQSSLPVGKRRLEGQYDSVDGVYRSDVYAVGNLLGSSIASYPYKKSFGQAFEVGPEDEPPGVTPDGDVAALIAEGYLNHG